MARYLGGTVASIDPLDGAPSGAHRSAISPSLAALARRLRVGASSTDRCQVPPPSDAHRRKGIGYLYREDVNVDSIGACGQVVLGTGRDFVQLPSSTLDRSDATCPRTTSCCSWLIYSNKVRAKFVRCLDVPVPWPMGSRAAIARFTGDESALEG